MIASVEREITVLQLIEEKLSVLKVYCGVGRWVDDKREREFKFYTVKL